MAGDNESDETLRDARNKGLQQEQERLSDPDHLTPDEEQGGDPVPAEDLGTARQAPDSIERLKNPPQEEGPREQSNDMI